MGSALHIPLPLNLKLGSSVVVKVSYNTTKTSTALGWLEKECVWVIVQVTYRLIFDAINQANSGKEFPVSVQSVPTYLC